MKKQIRSLLPFLIKITIVLLTFWFIYRELSLPGAVDKWHSLVLTITKNGGLISFLVVFGMMGLNWALETWKWMFLCQKIEHINYQTAVCSLLAGLNLAIFTPGRIGEYGGRVMYLRPENRSRGSIAMLVGALSQMLVTLVFGLIGMLFFIHKYLRIAPIFYILLLSGTLVLIAGLILSYFHVHWFNTLLLTFPFLRRFENSLEVLRLYNGSELLQVVLLSLCRYLVFSHQYYVLLLVLNGSAPYFMCMVAISLIFLVQSILPSFALADLGVRGAAAAFFLVYVIGTVSSIPILAAAFGVWLINIIFPAIIGLYFVLKLNFTVANTP